MITENEQSRADKIVQEVAKFYGVEAEEVTNQKNRHKSVTWARKMSAYLIRELMKLSYPSIAEALGYKLPYHEPVYTAYKFIVRKLKKDESLKLSVNTLLKRCDSYKTKA